MKFAVQRRRLAGRLGPNPGAAERALPPPYHTATPPGLTPVRPVYSSPFYPGYHSWLSRKKLEGIAKAKHPRDRSGIRSRHAGMLELTD